MRKTYNVIDLYPPTGVVTVNAPQWRYEVERELTEAELAAYTATHPGFGLELQP